MIIVTVIKAISTLCVAIYMLPWLNSLKKIDQEMGMIIVLPGRFK